MTSEGLTILQFMECDTEAWYSRKEISRRAVNRQEFEMNPQWATAALANLLNEGVIETNAAGLYRITPPKKRGY
jgi:hypothetical protein